jgi:hypothetical protein
MRILLNVHVQGYTVLQKSGRHLKILGMGRVTY